MRNACEARRPPGGEPHLVLKTAPVKEKHMKRIILITIVGIFSLGNLAGWAMTKNDRPFASNVNPETGEIGVSENYTEWPTLGTWAHAKVEGGLG
jgi:hypothetical protein